MTNYSFGKEKLEFFQHYGFFKIANIMQVLAMSDDDKDLKAQDLYTKFRHVKMHDSFKLNA